MKVRVEAYPPVPNPGTRPWRPLTADITVNKKRIMNMEIISLIKLKYGHVHSSNKLINQQRVRVEIINP